MAPFVGGAALPRGAVGGDTAGRGPVASMGRFVTKLDVALRAARRAGVLKVELHVGMVSCPWQQAQQSWAATLAHGHSSANGRGC